MVGVGEVALQFLDHRNDRVARVAYRENNLVVRVIQPAITGEILVRFGIHSTHRFQDADRWSGGVIAWRQATDASKIIDDVVKREEIVNQWAKGQ
jgi:hypothetical protein